MPITRSSSTTTSKNLRIHADGNSLPGELEVAAGLLISMRRDPTIGQVKSAAPAKRQREVRSSEVRPASRQRIAIDLTSDSTSPSPPQPAQAHVPRLSGHTAVSIAEAMKYKDIVNAFASYDAFMEANADFKTGAALLARHSRKLS
jgi:hypothetical protein